MATIKEYNFFNDSLVVFRGHFLNSSEEGLYFEGSPKKWHNSGLQIGNKTLILNYNDFTHFNFSIRLFSDTPLYDPEFSFNYWPSVESNELKLSSYCNLEDLYKGEFVTVSVPIVDIYNGTNFDIMKTQNFYFKSTSTSYKYQINSISLFDENFVEVVQGPSIEIHLNELDFGVSEESETMDLFFDIKNSGDRPLTNIVLTLPDNFSVDENNFSLEPLYSQTVKVSFNKTEISNPTEINPLFENLFNMFKTAKTDPEMKTKLKEQIKMFIEKL